MTRSLIAAALFLLLTQGAEAVTFGDQLGRAKVIQIVRQETSTFVREFGDMTNSKLEVSRGFDGAVTERVLEVEVEVPAQAEVTLRSRYRLLLANLTGFLLATKRRLLLDVEALTGYLEAASKAGRCGEVPCERGCDSKKPCDYRCNACPSARPGQEGS